MQATRSCTAFPCADSRPLRHGRPERLIQFMAEAETEIGGAAALHFFCDGPLFFCSSRTLISFDDCLLGSLSPICSSLCSSVFSVLLIRRFFAWRDEFAVASRSICSCSESEVPEGRHNVARRETVGARNGDVWSPAGRHKWESTCAAPPGLWFVPSRQSHRFTMGYDLSSLTGLAVRAEGTRRLAQKSLLVAALPRCVKSFSWLTEGEGLTQGTPRKSGENRRLPSETLYATPGSVILQMHLATGGGIARDRRGVWRLFARLEK